MAGGGDISAKRMYGQVLPNMSALYSGDVAVAGCDRNAGRDVVALDD